MKYLKMLFYALACLLLALCVFILLVALNPPISDQLADILYGEGSGLLVTETPAPEETESPMEAPLLPESGPVVTPIPLFTPGPEEEETVPERGAVYVVSTTLNEDSVIQYIPSGEYLVVPEEVSELAGYIPVETEIEEEEEDTDTEEEAPPQQEELYYEDLYFDKLFYPYYHMLEVREQLLYNQIYANLVEMRTIMTPDASYTSDVMKKVFEAVYNDHPELFYVDTAFSCKVNREGVVVSVTLKYNELAQDLATAKRTFNLRAGEILSGAQELDGNYEKEKYVHDKLTELVSYSSGAAMSQSAYSAIVNHETVCAGYARAFQYLMQQLNIPCYYCTGDSGMDHAWNITYLYGDYYNVDVTWDDTESVTYDYFNKTDDDFKKTHHRKSLSVYLPACLGTTYRNLAVVENTEEQDTTNQEAVPEENGFTLPEPLGEYYDKCYNRILETGIGTKEYTEYVDAYTWNQISTAYESGVISEAFFVRAFHATGGTSMAMRVLGEVQEDGTYKLVHTIVIN